MNGIRIIPLEDRGDARGSSWSVPIPWDGFLPAVRDLHVTTLLPGGVRGNHFHRLRREAIVILHTDRWALHWGEGQSGPAGTREFAGPGAVLLLVEPGIAHAVVNTGRLPLQTLGLTGAAWDPRDPDTVPRILHAPGS